MTARLAIFASGGGSNAEAIIRYFKDHPNIYVSLIVSNKPKAFILERARSHNIPTHILTRDSFYNSHDILKIIEEYKINLIILAGFLWLIPPYLIQAYPDRIINIHPALLPKYGGKGMYGHHVHQAVFDNSDEVSGMTVHLVNEEYDKGEILKQESVALKISDTPDIIASKVLSLEHRFFAPTIEKYIEERLREPNT